MWVLLLLVLKHTANDRETRVLQWPWYFSHSVLLCCFRYKLSLCFSHLGSRTNLHSKILCFKRCYTKNLSQNGEIYQINRGSIDLCKLGSRSIGINQDQSGSIGRLVFLIDPWLILIDPRLIWLIRYWSYWSNLFNQYFIYLYHVYFMAMCSTSTCKNKVEALCKFRQQSTEIYTV